jgi:hypothetical protein
MSLVVDSKREGWNYWKVEEKNYLPVRASKKLKARANKQERITAKTIAVLGNMVDTMRNMHETQKLQQSSIERLGRTTYVYRDNYPLPTERYIPD